MNEKYTFDLLIRKCPEKIIMTKGDCETHAHVAMKLMAYLFFYQPELKMEVDIGLHYKPDLVVMNAEAGRPDLWIDCGYVALKKAVDLLERMKQTHLIFIKENPHELKTFRQLLSKKTDAWQRADYVTFEGGFIQEIASRLERRNEITFYPSGEDVFAVIINGELFETRYLIERKNQKR